MKTKNKIDEMQEIVISTETISYLRIVGKIKKNL